MSPIKLKVKFYKTDSGSEPVRDWLKQLDLVDKKVIGADIKTVQFGWPLGMPLVGFIESGLWEVRSRLHSQRIARVLFLFEKDFMVLIHGFIKNSKKHHCPICSLHAVESKN
jgi:phage-related protein